MLFTVTLACNDSAGPPVTGVPPDSVRAAALGTDVVRVEWAAVEQATGYRIERRQALRGAFAVVAAQVPHAAGRLSWLDESVEPETDYGYRVTAHLPLGGRSSASTVAGATTPPAPGIVVRITTPPAVRGADADGYLVAVSRGADSTVAPMSANGARRFSPLGAGRYLVRLRGLASNCVSARDTQTVVVRADGLQTLAAVDFTVNCLDPERGRLVAIVNVEGEGQDADGFRIALVGLAADATLPDSVRIVSRSAAVDRGAVRFDDLRPGAYEVELVDVEPPCLLGGPGERQVTIAAQSADTVRFAVDCRGDGGGTTRPFIISSRFDRASAATSVAVPVDVSLDLRADPSRLVAGASFVLGYPAAVLRYDSISARQLPSVTVNAAAAGRLDVVAFSSSPPFPKNEVALARVWFTVTGAGGTQAATRTRLTEATDSDALIDTTQVRALDDTLVVVTATGGGGGGGGGGGTPNQPPVARTNGPYAGTVGAAIALSSSGTNDPDGTIATFAWAFGDGTTSTAANPSKSYATAGTYTVTLTVTDDRGASAASSTTATVTTAGSSLPFTWTSAFGAVGADSIVRLTITLDLTQDIPETPGPEALGAFVIDSLRWDPAVLRFHAINFGPGSFGTYSSSSAAPGRMSIRSTGIGTANQSGVPTIAVVQFKLVAGAAGRQATTATAIGAITGTNATDSFSYRSRTRVVEGTFTSP